MAHGWDSYYHDLPPLSSDPGTLRRTSESDGTISQRIENFIGHNDFSGIATSHEAPVSNSDFTTDYSSNPSIVNSSSDCVYQRYCSETQWQADGEQMEKDYLQSCENSDITDFAIDGLTASEPFPSSFAADLQGIKQDCGMLGTSFLENYSDVSSCSDADAGEIRPSCKFMASNLFPKPKTDVPTKHSSSEWFFNQAGSMAFPTESLCPNLSETNVISPSNKKSGESIVECAQKKVESPEKTESCAVQDESSTTSYTVTTTENETVHDRKDYDGCQDQQQKGNVERELTEGKYSDILISRYENLTGDKDQDGHNEDEHIPSDAPNIITTFNNEQDNLDVKVTEKKAQVLFSVVHDSSIPNSTNGQDENMETDCQDKEIETNTSQTSDPSANKASSSKNTTNELQECTNTLRSSSHDAESSVLLLEHQSSESVAQDNVCRNLAEISDGDVSSSGVASLTESCLQPKSLSTEINVCLDKELTSAEGQTTTICHPDPDCSGPGDTSDSIETNNKNKQGVASNTESHLKTDGTDANPHLDKELTNAAKKKNKTSTPNTDGSGPTVTGDSLSIDSSDKNMQDAAIHPESSSQPDCANTDIPPCLETEERTDTSSTEPQCSSHAVNSDDTKLGVSCSSESCLQPNASKTDVQSCSEKEWTSPVAQDPLSLGGDFAENARGSFEELDSAEEHSMSDMLYGEPLSREDSSCDADETKLIPNQFKEMTSARACTDSEGQAPQLKSSVEMKKKLQPVVVLKNLESTNGISHSYHCSVCQHTTHNMDHLIEHHHCSHSEHNFQFCKTCNVYLMRNEQAEKHLCTVMKKRHRPSSASPPKKKDNRHGYHKCMMCGLIFSKILQYITHMRTHTGKTPFKCNPCGLYFAQRSTLHRHQNVPGRCKPSNLPVTNSDADTITTEKPSPKDEVQNDRYANMPKCHVKLVDIYKTHLCGFCGKGFTSVKKAKKHYYNRHHGKSVAVSSNATKMSDANDQEVEEKTRGKHKCPLCPRVFKYSYNRTRHLRFCVKEAIYGGKQKVGGKYRCPLCHATFTLPSNRYRHIKVSCFREYMNRLAKERTQTRQMTDQQKTKEPVAKTPTKELVQKTQSKEPVQKTQSKEDVQKTQSKENERKKIAPLPLKTLTFVPRYKCNLCPAVFSYASGKYRHMKKHELFKLTGKVFKYRNSVLSIMSKQESLSSANTEESKDDDLKAAKENGTPALSCRFCGKCFSAEQTLKKHERGHRGERPYRCLECKKGFKKLCHLIGHKIVHQRRIQCTVCKKIFPNIGELIQHRSTHLKRGMLKCPDCPMQFPHPAHLLRHVKTHKNRENKAPAPLENKESLKPQQSSESVKEVEEPEQLQCSLCREAFNDAQILRKHCLTHISGSFSNQCPFCKGNFNTRRSLLRHMVKHTGDKPYSCTNCGKQFYRDMFFKLHSERCLPPQPVRPVTEPINKTKNPYQCSQCPRTFCKKDRVINHHRAHAANSLHLCSTCGQYFGINKIARHRNECENTNEPRASLQPVNEDVSNSTSQMSKMVQKMPLKSNASKMFQYECPQCPQRFRYPSLLSRHLVSHTGLQPYACVHCGDRFPSHTACLQHEVFCDGVDKEESTDASSEADTKQRSMPTREAAQKPQAADEEFKCKFCTKSFMKLRSMRTHILTHNEVKPYRCKTCDSCFSRYDHLKVHQSRCRGKKTRLEVRIPKISLDDVGKGWQNRFGIEPAQKQETFECKVCSRSFSAKSKLSRHFSMFHAPKLFKCTRCFASFSHERSLKKHKKKNKCKKTSDDTTASQPPITDPPAENVPKPLDGIKNRIIQRIQPFYRKKFKFSCSYCPRTFANNWQLNVHIRLHTGEKPYSCDYCGMRFIRKDYVKRHYPKCLKKKLHSRVLCDRCGGFFKRDKLENHKKRCTSTPSSSVSTESKQTSDSPPKGFSCAYCSSRFLLFSQLQEHFLNSHKVETMAPPVSTAPLQQLLSNIPNIKEEPSDKSCDEGRSGGTNVICNLGTALRSEPPKTFFCHDCNMSFLNKAGLAGHLRTHAVGRPHNCKLCNRGFWNKTLLRNHYRKCRNGGITTQQVEGPVKAEIDFALNESVLVFKEGSKTTGTGVLQTNFSCKDEAIDETPQDSEENQGQSSSDKEKKAVQYQCSECDKSFTDGLMLISHLEDHGREEQEKKRNTCNKCGRVCSNQANLEKHMRVHGIGAVFPCPNCPSKFDTISELESHKRCHDPCRPYVCRLCNLRFLTRPSLCDHYRGEHEEDVFNCKYCNKSYAIKKSLSRHYKKWHQKEQRNAVQEKSSSEQHSSSQAGTAGESDEDENNGSEDSDSDSADYFPCHVCGKTFSTSESLEDHQLCHLGKKPHECAECGKCFYQASQLQQHQRMHKSEFQCQMCGRGFVSLFALRKHKHSHGKNRPYRCSKCHLSFTGPTQLTEHMSTHREENFPCDICNRVFPSKISRAEHRKSHSSSGPPPSGSRGEHEKSAALSESSFVFSSELKYRCGVCNLRFRDPEELSEHGCLEAKERPYSCTDCNQHFLHASHLKKHRNSHQPSCSNSEYPCNRCNSSFSSSQHFISHLRSHVSTAAGDGRSSLSFICPVCHRCFAAATELIVHFPTHSDGAYKHEKITSPSGSELKERRLISSSEYECTQCGQSFLGAEAYRQHHCSRRQQAIIETKYLNPAAKTSSSAYYPARAEEEDVDVTGEDFFCCQYCSRQFSSKSGLLEHQNTEHSNGKPFTCDICGKTFAKKRYLYKHQRRHSEKAATAQLAENKIKCPQCIRRFSTALELSLHMRQHAEKQVGEYRCDMCYKSFSQWSFLKQHQESHVGEVVYECTECDKAFAFPHLLEEHQQTHAGSSQ